MIRFTGVRRLALLMTVFAALLLAGCAPSVVGKWEGNMLGQNSVGASANGTLEFKKDGKFEQNVSSLLGPAVATGTYTIEGDKINIKTEEITVGGKSLKGMLPPQVAQQIMSASNQSPTFKIESDKLTLDTGKGKATLTRAKP